MLVIFLPVRLFLARIMTDKARLANPGAIINTTVLSDLNEDPAINIIYRDGKKLYLRPGNKNIDEVLYIVNKYLRRLKDEEDFAV